MDNNWYMQIQSKVFTQVSYMMKKKYPSLNCTTKNENGLPATFPTLYLHELAPVEQGQDLTNETVNAVLSTIEIQVWTNTTETEVSDKIAWGVIRCRRMIGNGDKIMN